MVPVVVGEEDPRQLGQVARLGRLLEIGLGPRDEPGVDQQVGAAHVGQQGRVAQVADLARFHAVVQGQPVLDLRQQSVLDQVAVQLLDAWGGPFHRGRHGRLFLPSAGGFPAEFRVDGAPARPLLRLGPRGGSVPITRGRRSSPRLGQRDGPHAASSPSRAGSATAADPAAVRSGPADRTRRPRPAAESGLLAHPLGRQFAPAVEPAISCRSTELRLARWPETRCRNQAVRTAWARSRVGRRLETAERTGRGAGWPREALRCARGVHRLMRKAHLHPARRDRPMRDLGVEPQTPGPRA